MHVWISGRESQHIDDIIAGKKTVEGRLARGKFAHYAPGDIVELRRDFRDESGNLQEGEPNQARVRIVAIHRYVSFSEMLEREGIANVLPRAKSMKEAIVEYQKYYSNNEQAEYGVLGIVIELVPIDSRQNYQI